MSFPTTYRLLFASETISQESDRVWLPGFKIWLAFTALRATEPRVLMLLRDYVPKSDAKLHVLNTAVRYVGVFGGFLGVFFSTLSARTYLSCVGSAKWRLKRIRHRTATRSLVVSL